MFVLQKQRYSPFEKEVGRHWPSLSTIGQMNEKGEQLEFSDFSRILYSYIGLGDEHPKFVLELLSLVYLGDDGFFCNQNNPFLKMNTSTLNGYFRGSKKISEKNAGFIKSNFDSTEFIDKIDSLSVDLKTNLANELGVEDTDIKALPEKCADIFLQIISDIASGKNQKKVSLNTNSGQKDLEQKYGLSLLQECNSLCPLPECSKPLYVKKDEEKQPYFQIIQINPQKPYDRLYNLLAVCPECAAKFNMQKTEHDILRLCEIKRRMQKNEEISEFAAEEKIGQDITALIEKITNADGAELSELNYSPVELKKKFLPSEHQLEDEIKPHVVKYFNFINELLKQKVERENFSETKFRKSIKHIYENLEAEKFEKTQIFEAISGRFHNMSKTSYIACQILASYFVQSCEIFREAAQQ